MTAGRPRCRIRVTRQSFRPFGMNLATRSDNQPQCLSQGRERALKRPSGPLTIIILTQERPGKARWDIWHASIAHWDTGQELCSAILMLACRMHRSANIARITSSVGGPQESKTVTMGSPRSILRTTQCGSEGWAGGFRRGHAKCAV